MSPILLDSLKYILNMTQQLQAQRTATAKQEQLEKENYEKLMKPEEEGEREKRKSESEEDRGTEADQGMVMYLVCSVLFFTAVHDIPVYFNVIWI